MLAREFSSVGKLSESVECCVMPPKLTSTLIIHAGGMGDVEATIHLARLVRDRAPGVWNRMMKLSAERGTADILEREEILCRTYYWRGQAHTSIRPAPAFNGCGIARPITNKSAPGVPRGWGPGFGSRLCGYGGIAPTQ